MPTLDELLNASNEVATCTVNPDTREIIVPEKYKILGVFSDEKVTKIPFTCPKVVGNNVDLTEYKLYINYQNAIGRHNAYLVDDAKVSGDNITFSWLLSRDVTLSSGVVKYSLCAKKLNGDSISNEWNTTIANGVVIQGLEATQAIIAEKSDIIEAILSKAHTHANKLILDKFAETDGKPTYDGKTFLQSVSTDDIDERAVTNAKISNGAISTGKIANNAVTEDKLSTEFVAKVDGKQDKITSTNKLAYSLISGTPTIPNVPTALPNPNALTFTGAVTGSYDGSAPLSVEIPSGGGSGSDVSLGLTGAAAGQIAMITAVDESGTPTAWAPVDFPIGGGGSTSASEEIVVETHTISELPAGRTAIVSGLSKYKKFMMQWVFKDTSASADNACYMCFNESGGDYVPYKLGHGTAWKQYACVLVENYENSALIISGADGSSDRGTMYYPQAFSAPIDKFGPRWLDSAITTIDGTITIYGILKDTSVLEGV